jgi:hypothetical protein
MSFAIDRIDRFILVVRDLDESLIEVSNYV